ncbi:hypothetical protein KP509_05G011000 [Ceratopteris richardii]|uniref:Uncharacterized protein n=1 Tax=Ceratopteris richardii TaxID=49495 RepID=A0A8T2UJE9_CERRI|nr:hypothetical protein KP509_05G011000 [Ceratopteris richardii]
MFHHRLRLNGEDIPDFALEHVFSYVTDSSDRDSISRVCKRWYQIEGRTCKDVTISCCYAIDPSRLTKRFSVLENVKLKGKPRASMFRLIPEDWGGHACPWISEIALNCRSLQSLHLRRMILSDKDLIMLGNSVGILFKFINLIAIASTCRSLRVLILDDSIIEDRGGEWLHELAISNILLETLNFSGTNLQHVNIDDLLCVASNCRSLKSLKLHEINIVCLKDVIQKGTYLEELGVKLPSSLKSLVGLCHMGTDDAYITINSLVQPIAAGLKKVFNDIGDKGLKVISENCPKLRHLRIERGDREEQHGFVTQRGLIYVATHCHDLEYIVVYASNINNTALKAIADNCPKLRDFRLVLLDEDNDVAEYPLEDGMMALVKGCSKICRLALYLRRGFLSDKCMGFLGEHCKNLRWALFGLLGETDMGLRMFAEKSPNIEKLEKRDCVFTESGIAKSGFNSTGTGRDLIPMSCESGNVEMFTGPVDELVDGPLTFLAYQSLVGRRKDIPSTVICLG